MLTATAMEPMARSLTGLIARHPFMEGMNPTRLGVFAECAMLTHFAEGQVIFREGDLADRFYLVQKGRVSLESRTGPAATIPIQTIGRREVLGWSWLFPPYYWHFSARALEPTDVIFFSGTQLRRYCEADPEFGFDLIKRMAAVAISRLQATREKMVRLSRTPPGKRHPPGANRRANGTPRPQDIQAW